MPKRCYCCQVQSRILESSLISIGTPIKTNFNKEMKAYGKIFNKDRMELTDCLRRLCGQEWDGERIGTLPTKTSKIVEISLFPFNRIYGSNAS